VIRLWLARVAAAVLVATGYSWLPHPTQPPALSRAPAAVTTAQACRAGEPERLVIPTLGIDAAFEKVGLASKPGRVPLGDPTDSRRAGWYAAGPRPGSKTGTVLTNGHTQRNGPTIFHDDFAQRIAVRQLVTLKQHNGSVCSYRVTRVWHELSSRRSYPRLVVSQHLYDFSGPERLLLATTDDGPDAAGQDDRVSVLLAAAAGR